ncbi:hypothetical protein, partial [Psychroflexus sp. MES1-P1E]|uniref:hypothetical protein n=1 Tax=Psychroflexus sp. MES1-P1E TaxID=2058320 RepID=UPI000CAA65B0
PNFNKLTKSKFTTIIWQISFIPDDNQCSKLIILFCKSFIKYVTHRILITTVREKFLWFLANLQHNRKIKLLP